MIRIDNRCVSLSILRTIAYILAICLLVECVPASVTAAAAAGGIANTKQIIQRIKSDVRDAQQFQNLQEENAMLPKVDMASLAKLKLAPLTSTMLDSAGLLARPIDAKLVAAWKREIALIGAKRGPAVNAHLAKLHVWVGEYELAHDQQPEEASDHFAAAQHLTAASESWHGLAAYDSALGLLYMGAYEDASEALGGLARAWRTMSGYPLGTCVLMERHANACAAYHAERAAAGITEPPRLDPLCGVAGLGAALRAYRKPYDEATVLKACPVTGEGSSLQGLVNAGPKLGLSVHAVQADEKGLRLLPKPLIAYVERDHFITVTNAGDDGVDYLCIDCGMWPGMHRHLTWKQWRMMAAGIYGAVCLPGSAWDRALQGLPAAPGRRVAANIVPIGAQIAAAAPIAGISITLAAARISALILNHVVQDDQPSSATCGNKPTSPPCPSCLICCLMDACGLGSSGNSGNAGGSSGFGLGGLGLGGLGFGGFGGGDGFGMGGGPYGAPTAGPADGDPVNLATGEEEYTPAPDLIVYNPIGPSVTWQRIYNSLRSPNPGDKSYESDDFGVGWSQAYNVGVYDPTNGNTGAKFVILENGGRVSFIAPSIPSAINPAVQCAPQQGAPFLVEWDCNPTTGEYYYTITWKNRTKWVTTGMNPASLCSALASVVDRNGHAIHFS